MNIDAGSFFILVGTLAAGGGAGYFASQKHVFEPRPVAAPTPRELPPPATVSAPIASVAVPAKPAPPPCDDAVGSPGTCPPPGYSADESGCGALPTKRCNDFKLAMKPRVAERAVACLNALKPGERCDPARLNLCGHVALMSACQEAEDADKDAADAITSGLTAVCQTVLQECIATPFGPTLRDCRATLSGMSEAGRSKMALCMKTHCTDKGLLNCEALVDVK
jgi:hypothetical protein